VSRGNTFPFCLHLFIRTFSSPTLFAATGQQPTFHDFLSQQNNTLFPFLSELMDLFVAGRDQSAAAEQPNNLAEGHPP
jgi:hypothetical protein